MLLALTGQDGSEISVNPAQIAYVTTGPNGSTIYFAAQQASGQPLMVYVRETQAELRALLAPGRSAARA
jgi:hypothetical protein